MSDPNFQYNEDGHKDGWSAEGFTNFMNEVKRQDARTEARQRANQRQVEAQLGGGCISWIISGVLRLVLMVIIFFAAMMALGVMKVVYHDSPSAPAPVARHKPHSH